jgi:hypothetical protein
MFVITEVPAGQTLVLSKVGDTSDRSAGVGEQAETMILRVESPAYLRPDEPVPMLTFGFVNQGEQSMDMHDEDGRCIPSSRGGSDAPGPLSLRYANGNVEVALVDVRG